MSLICTNDRMNKVGEGTLSCGTPHVRLNWVPVLSLILMVAFLNHRKYQGSLQKRTGKLILHFTPKCHTLSSAFLTSLNKFNGPSSALLRVTCSRIIYRAGVDPFPLLKLCRFLSVCLHWSRCPLRLQLIVFSTILRGLLSGILGGSFLS